MDYFSYNIDTNDIYNLQDCEWNISGAFSYDEYLLQFIDIIIELSNGNNQIKSVFGCPPNFIWNGGRYLVNKSLGINIEEIIEEYNRRNIEVHITANNFNISEADICNRDCNQIILSLINMGFKYNVRNGIIVSDETLFKYIKTYYPSLKTTSSIIKVSSENCAGDYNYYNRLSKRFDKIVLHPDDNFNVDLLNKIDFDNVEICVNEQCIYLCRNRSNHYNTIGNYNKGFITIEQVEQFEDAFCICGSDIFSNKNITNTRNSSYTKKELRDIYNNYNLKKFKIQGRRDPNFTFLTQLYDMCKYILKEDLYSDLVFRKMVKGKLNEL